jgi:vitamin-K-epoxide reductase (warfarin-sensitive)
MQFAMKGRSWQLTTVLLLSLAGVIVSSISLYHHFDKSESSFCDLGGKFNCDIVNRSIYSHMGPIPVALIGILGYLSLAVMAYSCRKRNNGKTFLFVSTFVGLVFALYLTYIEGFVLAAWCVMCLTSLALICIITILTATVTLRTDRSA